MALTKIIDLGFEVPETGEPRVQLLNQSLVKTASTEIQNFWDALEDDPGHSYLWVIGVSAREFYGCNNNGDAFDEAELKANHHFFTESANVFLQHVNKDPNKGIGKPVFSWYNDAMHRIELILKIDKSKASAAETVRKIQAGEPIFVSMGTTVAYDVCSICGNKAPTRRDYCDHLRYNMKKILPDGRQVYALNPNPKFFDISIVAKPADPTAFTLDKKASVNGCDGNSVVVSSAKLGEMYEENAIKLAALKKLSDIVKQVDGNIADIKDSENKSDTHIDAVKTLSSHFDDFSYPEMPYEEISNHGVSPSAFIRALHGMNAPITLGDAAWLAGSHAFGRCPTRQERHEMFRNLPHSIAALMDRPELVDSLLHSICSPYNGDFEDEARREVMIRIMRPVATVRITMIRGMAPDGELEKIGEALGRSELESGVAFGRGTGEIIANTIRATKPSFSSITMRDRFGREVKTTPYHLRQAFFQTDLPGKILRPAAAAALGLGAVACALTSPTMSGKLLGSLALAAPAVAIANSGPTYNGGIYTSEGMPVSDQMAKATFKWQEKTGALKLPNVQAPGIGTVGGMAIPAALALDYAWNKWRSSGPEGYMHPIPDGISTQIGEAVSENPMTGIALGGVAGAAAQAGLEKLFTKKVPSPMARAVLNAASKAAR